MPSTEVAVDGRPVRAADTVAFKGMMLTGDSFPWVMSWDYASDAKLFRKGAVEDRHLRFTPQRTGRTR